MHRISSIEGTIWCSQDGVLECSFISIVGTMRPIRRTVGMATTPAAKGRAASATTRAATAAAAPDVQTKGVSRREFMYYIWGASMALLLAETGGAIIWFALPRFRAGEFGGVFNLDPATLPAKGSAPVGVPAGKYWLSNTNNGLYALS